MAKMCFTCYFLLKKINTECRGHGAGGNGKNEVKR